MNITKWVKRYGFLSLLVLVFSGAAWSAVQFTAVASPLPAVNGDIDRLQSGPNQPVASISMTGTTDIKAGEIYTYTITYSGVLTGTGSIQYLKPAPDPSPLNEQKDQWAEIVFMDPKPSGPWNPLYIWNYATIGYSGQIVIAVKYNTDIDLCPTGKFQHRVDLTDNYPDPTDRIAYLPITKSCQILLPIVRKPAKWSKMTDAALKVADLDIDQGRLFVADYRAPGAGGGLYVGNMNTCSASGLARRTEFRAQSVDVNDQLGISGSFAGKVLFSTDQGNTWTQTANSMNPYVYATIFTNQAAYAGADDGVYESTDGGRNWQLISGSPGVINKLFFDGQSTVWVATYGGGGIYTYNTTSRQFANVSANLGQGRQVWDVVADGSGNVFIATSNGVFRRASGQSDWVQLGSAFGIKVYSLALVGQELYAGTDGQGVFTHSTSGTDVWYPVVGSSGWQTNAVVRKLSYVSAGACPGLYAGTDSDVWVFGK